MPESVLISQLHLSKACLELWLSDDQPHSDYNGQWQRALCILAVLQSSQPNPQRNEKKRKMYAINRLDLSGTPGLRPIGLSPGFWQTSLGLGSMSWYSAQILICITNVQQIANCGHHSHDDVIKQKYFPREAGDLRRHRAHYDATAMSIFEIPRTISVQYWQGKYICIISQNKELPHVSFK